jgi:hypothetical protein
LTYNTLEGTMAIAAAHVRLVMPFNANFAEAVLRLDLGAFNINPRVACILVLAGCPTDRQVVVLEPYDEVVQAVNRSLHVTS